jgi:iron complex outermembrane receptor protein
LLGASAAMCLCFAGLAAQAAQPAGGAPASSSGSGPQELSEVIVTARRVEERLQDVPISITVFNQQQIANRNIVTATDLATYTPSLSANSGFGTQNTTFAIRGFVQDNGTPPSVGVYFADVVAPRAASNNLPVGNGAGPGDFFDLQNVQVLKGPQGTLFGRNTTGGAVLFVPVKPTDKFEGYLEASGGNYAMRRIQGVINVPLSSVARLRLGVDHMDRDGFVRNTTGIGPKDFQDLHYTAARASLVLDLAPDLENYTIASYSRSEDHGPAGKMVGCDASPTFNGSLNLIGLGLACPAFARDVGKGFYTTQNVLPDPFSRSLTWQVINTTTWRESENLTIKNIVSYAQQSQTENAMLFGTAFDNADLGAFLSGLFHAPISFPHALMPFATVTSIPGGHIADQSTLTEEIQFQGHHFDGRLDWQAGIYFENSEPLSTYGSQSPVLISCTNSATFQCTDFTAPVFGGAGIGQVSDTTSRVHFRDLGVYSQATWKFNDQIKLTGGIRYTDDRTDAAGQLTSAHFFAPNEFTTLCTIPATTANNCRAAYNQKSSAPTWLVGLDYTPDRDTLLYAKYSRGYRAGGVTLQAPPQVAVFSPEKVNVYETGLKKSFRGAMPATLNIAAFYNDFTNQQLQLNLTPIPPNRVLATGILNAGQSRMYGVELDGAISPFPRLRIEGSYAYIDAKIERIALPSLDPSGGYTLEAQAIHAGDPLPLTPKNKLSVTATYTLPVDERLGRVYIGGTFTHTDRQLVNYTDRFNPSPALAGFSFLQARDLLNLNANWDNVGGHPVDLAFFMTNVTNQKYYAFIPGLLGSLPFETAILGEPRMFGFRARYKFAR